MVKLSLVYKNIDSPDTTTRNVTVRICIPLLQPLAQTMKTVSSGAPTTMTVEDSFGGMTTAISKERPARTIL